MPEKEVRSDTVSVICDDHKGVVKEVEAQMRGLTVSQASCAMTSCKYYRECVVVKGYAGKFQPALSVSLRPSGLVDVVCLVRVVT